jgi:hypothetical protein
MAIKALLSCGASTSPSTLETLKSKFPVSEPPVCPVLEQAPASLSFEEWTVRANVFSFPGGSGAGPSGFRPQFLKDVLTCASSAVSDAVLKGLTSLTNLLVGGLAPRELAPLLSGGLLIALLKKSGDLRPICIGEVWRRLTSKCCCVASREKALNIFGDLQVGVGQKAGAEATIHAIRRLADRFGDDPGKILLQVDLSNAFNMADRSVLLSEVQERIPEFFRWVEFCYGGASVLFFGSTTLDCSTGLQQGDPLAPLLFSLVLMILCRRLKEECEDLDLNVWYLDDGSLVGDRETVRKALGILIKEGQPLEEYSLVALPSIG